MIRIYCDSQIYRYLKPNHPSYTKELFEIFELLKDKFVFTFSDAHLDDLRTSPKDMALSDLAVMETYVKDNYFMQDVIQSKETTAYLATPTVAFNGKDYDAYNTVLDNPFNVDNLFKDLEDFPFVDTLKDMLKLYMDMPIAAFQGNHSTLELNETDKAFMEKITPNYSNNSTVGEMIQDFWPYSKKLLEDKRTFVELRKFMRRFMNSDEYSFEKFGMGFNDKFREGKIGKSFLEFVDSILSENDKHNPYERFIRIYTMLEIYNVTFEKTSKGKIKEFDLSNLNTDAAHSWYASFSDYFVTDDKGLQIKAAIMYSLLNIPTKILSSKDFKNNKSIFLGQEETTDSFIDSLVYDLKNSFQLHQYNNPLENFRVDTFKTSHNYFNYFNRYQLIIDDNTTFVALYCDRCSKSNFFMYRELEILIKKFLVTFGTGDEYKGEYNFNENEIIRKDEAIRTWNLGNKKITTFFVHKSWGSSICLTIQIK
jgi:hypothetical protein